MGLSYQFGRNRFAQAFRCALSAYIAGEYLAVAFFIVGNVVLVIKNLVGEIRRGFFNARCSFYGCYSL